MQRREIIGERNSGVILTNEGEFCIMVFQDIWRVGPQLNSNAVWKLHFEGTDECGAFCFEKTPGISFQSQRTLSVMCKGV